MSTVLVLAPVVIANWSTIAAAVTVAVASAGFTVKRRSDRVNDQALPSNLIREEMEVDASEILEGSDGSGQTIVVEKGGIRATFRRDACGALKVCLEARGIARAELRRLGDELIGRVVQQYVYQRIVTELASRNMLIIEEVVAEDRTVRLRVRNGSIH